MKRPWRVEAYGYYYHSVWSALGTYATAEIAMSKWQFLVNKEWPLRVVHRPTGFTFRLMALEDEEPLEIPL